MSGDYTRDTFRKRKHYSRVRMQQGRVQLDSDWNEQVDITRHIERTTSRDVIGSSGFPSQGGGFRVSEIGGSDLRIHEGHGYVDGILVESERSASTTLTKISGTGVQSLWEVTSGPWFENEQWVEDDTGQAIQVTSTDWGTVDERKRQEIKLDRDLGDGPVTVVGLHSYRHQPWFPGEGPSEGDGFYLAYLDVWEREIGALEDPEILESALQGVDTTVRTKVLWQVRLKSLTEWIQGGKVSSPPVCDDFSSEFSPSDGEPRALLAAQTKKTEGEPDLCGLPSEDGYRSRENHLYRVEVHRGNSGGEAIAVKWSRDNATYRARVLEVQDGHLRIEASPGSLRALDTAESWVEMLDEARILRGEGGFFVRVGEIHGERLEILEILDPVSLQPLENGDEQPDIAVLPESGLIRVWEGGKPVEIESDTWFPLENEVEAKISEGLAETTDYWLIPARALEGTIEWPRDLASGDAIFMERQGIVHRYAPLALLELNANVWSPKGDCRHVFAPMTEAALYYVGGDGQEATPRAAAPNEKLTLAEPLSVGVSRGSLPVQGARVRFKVTEGSGLVEGESQHIGTTNEFGIASIPWELDAGTLHQKVIAELVIEGGQRRHLPIEFNARLNRATEVSFDPENCPDLAGNETVQLALEALCARQKGGCATYVLDPSMDWIRVLKELKEGENAKICFQRGHYSVSSTIELNKLGHISLSGIGDGTRIEALGTETALRFVGCASVTVRDLCVEAPDGSTEIGHRTHLNGTIATVECRRVEVQNCFIKCGAGAGKERACLSIRGASGTSVECLRVKENRLKVGDNQIGILVADVLKAEIEDNDIQVAKRPKKLTFEKLIAHPIRRAGLAKLLAARPVLEERVASVDKAKTLVAGRFTARLRSAVPESEWRGLMKESPPTEIDIKSHRAFKGYVDGLVNKAVENPASLPSYERQLKELGGELDERLRKNLAISGDVDVKDFDEISVEKRDVALVLDNNRVQYDSPLKEPTWRQIVIKDQGGGITRSNAELLGQVRRSAKRLLIDESFRTQFGEVLDWIRILKENNPAVGYQGIVCGGETLDDVRIRGNSMRGFWEAIRVGVSRSAGRGERHLSVGSVDISENRMEVRPRLESREGRLGVFIGNARRVRVQDNRLDHRVGSDGKVYAEGIRIWGYLGSDVILRQNSTLGCRVGIRLRPIGTPQNRLWRLVDNLVVGGGIQAPGATLRGNESSP